MCVCVLCVGEIGLDGLVQSYGFLCVVKVLVSQQVCEWLGGFLVEVGVSLEVVGVVVEGWVWYVLVVVVWVVKCVVSGMGWCWVLELYWVLFLLYVFQVDFSVGLFIVVGGGGVVKMGIKNGVVRVQGYWGWIMLWVEGDFRGVVGVGCILFLDVVFFGWEFLVCWVF